MKKILLGILTLSIIFNPYYVYAEEIVVSGNGSDSNSNVNVNLSQNTSVSQDNTAEVNNNVSLNADTGNNTANDNTGGDTSITTGNVNIDSNIENRGINQSSVDVGCCPGDTGIEISGNGANSDNSIAYAQNNSTNINVNNTANISNNVNGKANTGFNEANNNTGGNVSISTGSITVNDTIKNNSVNVYEVDATSGNGQDVSITIKDNGTDSFNSIKFSDDSNVAIDINNSANIVNNSNWDLNTGGNKANGNTGGDVSITTGDIVFNSTIENTGINVGLVDIECCEEENGGPGPGPGPGPDGNPPVQPPPPPPTTNPGPTNGGNPTSAGGVAAAPGEVLPVTGSASLLFLAIANIIMFFMGWYLRLRSGRSPNIAFAR
ncbi:MAG: hypothetical protein HY426_03515 [Candidatus Levybacteria bacterium]|nr:hypothetical protein [Candidatus Levybacteria bacterium]